VVSLSVNELMLKEISDIVDIKEDLIEDFINENEIIYISEGKIKFVSSTHKDYFSNIYRTNQAEVDQLLIRYHSSSSQVKSLINLPELFFSQGQWSDLIDCVNSSNYVENVLQETGDVRIVTKNLQLGIESSLAGKQFSESFELSLKGSIVNDFDNFISWESEIEAQIALGQYKEAVNFAQKAIVKLDRLQLLIHIAKRIVQNNEKLKPELT
jgi:hypothetical protein